MCSSEVLTAEVRRRIRLAFGVEPFNVYAATEPAGIAAECERHRLHLFEDLVITEVVDDRNRPVPAGIVGAKVPVMLPEDLRFTGVKPEQLPPKMSEWLAIVFRTWGGFMVGFGVVLMGVAAYLVSARKVFLCWMVAVGLVVAFGRFLVSNLALRSEYLVFIAILFGLAAVTAVGLALSSCRDSQG